MSTSLEARLERAGRTLDRASEQYRAERPLPGVRLPGVTLPAVDRDVAGGPRRAPVLVSLAAAAMVVVMVGAVLVGGRHGGESSTAASGDGGPVGDAVAATRAVPAMAVGTVTTVETEEGVDRALVESWNYGAPDRWEQLSPTEPAAALDGALLDGALLDGAPPSGVTVRLHVGSESWGVADGRWVAEPDGQAVTPAPIRLLDTLARLDCHAEVTGELVVWSSVYAGCDAGGADRVPQLPVGSPVWVIARDAHGRITRVDRGTVLDLGPDANVDGSTRAINRVGASAETTTLFWYDGVPEVSGRPEE